MSKGYVWYSFGSDKSGPELAAALSFDADKKTPDPNRYSIVVGWGAKTGTKYDRSAFTAAVASGKLRVLNPIEAIEANRNKLETLRTLSKAGVMVPGFVERSHKIEDIQKALRDGQIALPLIGLTRENKGAPVFFYTLEDVIQAPKEVEYFRSFVPGTEYRIHILRNTVLLAQRKQQAKDPVQACVADLEAELTAKVEKDPSLAQILTPNVRSPAVLRTILTSIATELLAGPNQIARSVSHGWELVDVSPKSVSEKVLNEAVRALEAAGLDLGAVSVTLDEKNPHARPAVTVITTGPALPEAHLKVYAQALRDFSAGGEKKEKVPAIAKPVDPKAPRELIAEVTAALSNLSEKEARRMLAFLRSDD